ncbi:uncharacterized protein KY384_005641 [Bacidia gigantensis]|uniref:uncharacterized protein n=1 Tax=Bacidia gigantensis TaxID=2732470 RepID=UPI001D04197C|nr:uncharacterized protein KY384_005641 [Bacidia gigantensis]KAG8530158.1 hypothetical protein KY384_005641 [Bacidia gigantensis]
MSSVSISLQAPPLPIPNDLQYLISRINEQKGGFRNVTEESLEEEIKNGAEEAVEEESEDDEPTDDEEDPQSKKEKVQKAKEEMLKQVNQAHQETAMALDFISLLLSQRTPGPAGLTLSPYLKQNLPLGSLGAEKVQAQDMIDAEKEQGDMLALGVRMESLNDSANSILKSATRLEREVEKETKYWEEVLKAKENGWSLLRLPREKHTLGVRYGFAEAAPAFRDRGLAALRQNGDGSISLDRGPNAKNDRLCLRCLQNGKVISTLIDYENPHAEGSLERDILDARNSIYDEEVFFELNREAQHLASYGVQCIEDKILLPFKNHQQIEIALEPVYGHEASQQTQDDLTLKQIMLLLRLLLSQAHKQNLHTRSQTPPPLRDRNPPRTIHPILKPLVEILEHQSQIAKLHDFLTKLSTSLSKASLPFTFSTTHKPTPPSPTPPQPTTAAQISTLLSSLTTTSLAITLPGPSSPLIVQASTAVGGLNPGTSFTISPDPDSATTTTTTNISRPTSASPRTPAPAITPALIHPSLPALVLALTSHLQDAIKEYIKITIPSWKDAEIGIEVMERRPTPSKNRGGDGIAIEIKEEGLELRWWKVKTALELDPLIAVGEGRSGGGGEKRFTWRAAREGEEGEEGGETRSLREVVEGLGL